MLALLIFVFAISIPAFASDYDNAAKDLEDLGLFKGTLSGYELDRAPTRTEAAVMLVRLLGAEADAEAQLADGTISHPFTDVPSWADSYVAWLYSNELTNGVTSTTYGAADECSAKMYCTFVLRALGYSDSQNADFSYETAEEFAQGKGIFNTLLSGDSFLRDDAVAISYQALASEMKSGSETLLEHLVAEGAVTQTAAAPLLSKIDVYREYMADCAYWNGIKAIDMSTDFTMAIDMPALGTTIDATGDADIKTIMNGDDIQMEAIVNTSYGTTTATISEWVKDGYLYMNTGTEKYKMPLGLDALLQTVSEQSMYSNLSVEGLYTIESITSTKTQDGTLYSIEFSNGLNSLVNQMVSTAGTGFGAGAIDSLSMDHMSYDVLIGKDGIPVSIDADFSISMDLTVEGQTYSCAIDYDMDCAINKTGSAVVISFPDFSDYPEFDPNAAA